LGKETTEGIKEMMETSDDSSEEEMVEELEKKKTPAEELQRQVQALREEKALNKVRDEEEYARIVKENTAKRFQF